MPILEHPQHLPRSARWNVMVADFGVRGCVGSYRWLWRARMRAHSYRRFWPTHSRVVHIEWGS